MAKIAIKNNSEIFFIFSVPNNHFKIYIQI